MHINQQELMVGSTLANVPLVPAAKSSQPFCRTMTFDIVPRFLHPEKSLDETT